MLTYIDWFILDFLQKYGYYKIPKFSVRALTETVFVMITFRKISSDQQFCVNTTYLHCWLIRVVSLD